MRCTDDFQPDEVHPRIRGEYNRAFLAVVRKEGSPPHTRGIRIKDADGSCLEGFTPAYAGNTCKIPPLHCNT